MLAKGNQGSRVRGPNCELNSLVGASPAKSRQLLPQLSVPSATGLSLSPVLEVVCCRESTRTRWGGRPYLAGGTRSGGREGRKCRARPQPSPLHWRDSGTLSGITPPGTLFLSSVTCPEGGQLRGHGPVPTDGHAVNMFSHRQQYQGAANLIGLMALSQAPKVDGCAARGPSRRTAARRYGPPTDDSAWRLRLEPFPRKIGRRRREDLEKVCAKEQGVALPTAMMATVPAYPVSRCGGGCTGGSSC